MKVPRSVAEFWRKPRARKWSIWVGGALVVYLLVGFFLVPVVIKWQLLKQLPPATHRSASVRQVKFNPLALSLTIRGLGLAETNGQPFVSFEEFYANFQLSSLFRLAWTFDRISLTDPRTVIVLGEDGRFNFADLLEPSTNAPPKPEPKSEGGLPRLTVLNLSVTNGHLGFADLSRKTPFRTAYHPINFNLHRFTTRPDRDSSYSFQASSSSDRGIAWSGTVSAQPLGSRGSLLIRGVHLPVHSPYVEDFTRAQLTGGSVDVAGNYRFEVSTNGTDLVASNLVVTLSNFELKDPGTDEVVLAVPSFALQQGTVDLRARRAKVESITVDQPRALVRRMADGTLNIPSLIVRRYLATNSPAMPTPPGSVPSANAPPQPPWIIVLSDYQLRNGSVTFEDATVAGPFRTVLSPLNVGLQGLTTATNSSGTLHLEATTEQNESIKLASELSLNPVRSSSTLQLSDLELQKYQPFFAPFFRGVLTGGKAGLTLSVRQELRGNVLQTAVSNAAVRVANLAIQDPATSQTVVSIPEFAVENASGSLEERAVQVGAITSSGVEIHATRAADGTINLLGLLPGRDSAASSTNTLSASVGSPQPPDDILPATQEVAAPAVSPWSVALNELALRDWAIHFTDNQIPNPGRADLDQLSLTLKGAHFPSNAPVAAEFSTRVNGAGTMAVRGTVLPYSPSADAEIQIAGLALRGFQPWVEPHAKLGIESGLFDLTGRVQFAEGPANSGKLRFTGQIGVADFATVDHVLFKEFVRWDRLSVAGIDLTLQPSKLAVEQIQLAGLKTSVIISSNKVPNFSAVLPPRPPDAASPREASPPAAPTPAPSAEPGASSPDAAFPIELGEFRLEKAAIHFEDESVQPPCSFDVRQLGGTVKGLSSSPDSVADVDISGQVDEGSPFALRGKMNPLAREPVLDLVFTNSNLQLTPFTPYMEKFVGHPLNKGRLSLNLDYSVQGKELKAANQVNIDQLMLGPRNDNPDATKIPVKLGVALLKDINGRIALDVPLDGRLDDPAFKVGPVIVQVLGNLIVKAAASPFKLIGSLVGGGEELSFVEFQPGQTLLLQSETNKLVKLVQALEKRPALNLEIEGSVDPVADRDALARARVRDEIKSERLRELAGVGQAPPSAEAFQLEPVEYERLLRAAVVARFGTNLAQAVREVAERAALATSSMARKSPQPPGLMKRVASLFKPATQRAAIRQAYRTSKADALLRQQNPELAMLSADDMEMLLAAKTEIPPDDLRRIMEERAKAVQSFLLSGGVNVERLFLLAPKPVDAAYKGGAKANLSLN
ncbi:MAG: DUF748 domain-containing protein [Verrucomicrobiia bacterium]